MKFLIALVLLGLIYTLFSFIRAKKGANHIQHPAINLISPIQLSDKIKEDSTIQLVDIRTNLEYKSGIIHPAKNINFFDKNFRSHFKNYDKKKPIYIYCKSGRRSAKASLVLAKEGFKEIYDLEGGILNWNNKIK